MKSFVEDLRDVEDEMPGRYLLEDIHAEPFPELHHALLMTRRTEIAASEGDGRQTGEIPLRRKMRGAYCYRCGEGISCELRSP